MKKVNINLLVLFIGVLTSLNLHAHDPFDGSARMTVRSEDIELTITFGSDAARRTLATANLTTNEVTDLMKPRGPKSYQTVPISAAGHFFTIRHGDEELSARSATLLSDGMEVIFTVVYPRPAAGELTVRAMYYDKVEEMRSGLFVAYDENGKQLGGAVLSRANARMAVPLPARETNPTAPSTK